MKAIDLSNQRFGRLAVVGRAANNAQGGAAWACLCDCGTSKTVSAGKLRAATTKSCGCLRAEAQNLKDRIRQRVDIDPKTGCWNWKLRVDRNGYGRAFDTAGRFFDGAHRLSYRAFHGVIPDGMFVLHICDNKRCCNPTHLFPGTQQDNVDDMWLKSRGHRK